MYYAVKDINSYFNNRVTCVATAILFITVSNLFSILLPLLEVARTIEIILFKCYIRPSQYMTKPVYDQARTIYNLSLIKI